MQRAAAAARTSLLLLDVLVLLQMLLRAAGGTQQKPFPRRNVYPQSDPDVCIVLISYESSRVKLDGLDRVYGDVISYLDNQKLREDGQESSSAHLRYEIVWVDNGSSDSERNGFRRKMPQMERTVLFSRNVGLYGAMNAAWFGEHGCTAPYVLSLEDDWVPKEPSRGAWSSHHISDCMDILRSDTNVGGVRLKDDWTDDVIPMSTWQGGGRLPRFRTQVTDIKNGMVWGSFTTAGVLYDRQRLLQRVGEFYGSDTIRADEGPSSMPWEYGEGNYAVRCGLPIEFGGGGLSTALPHWEDTCSRSHGSADGNIQRHCHAVFFELRQKTERELSDSTWFLWGTLLHPDNASLVAS